MKREARSTSETWALISETTWLHIPEFGCSEPCEHNVSRKDKSSRTSLWLKEKSIRLLRYVRHYSSNNTTSYPGIFTFSEEGGGGENLKFCKVYAISRNKMLLLKSTRTQEVVVQPALGYHITNSQSHYITPTRLKSAHYSVHNNAPSSRRLLKMNVWTSETCWAVKWHNRASVIKLGYLYSNIKIMQGPIRISKNWIFKRLSIIK